MGPLAAALQPPPILQALLEQLVAYLPGIANHDTSALSGCFQSDRAMDITYAERAAKIDLADVVKVDDGDQDMDRMRRKFVRALFQRGWALPQVARLVPVSKSYLEKERAEARKSCNARAMLPG